MKRYVKIEPAGTRIGNWLFQYAAVKSMYPNDEIVFYITGGKHLDEPERYSEIWPDVSYVYELPQGCEPIVGLFQDATLLDAKIVQQSIREPRLIHDRIFDKYGEWLKGRTVGISVRRGDYMRFPHIHPFVGKTYLRNAVNLLDDGDCVFVVCSDDIPWCRKFFKGKRFVFIENEDVLTQLFVHTHCTDNIVSNSTFSWWGAYLNPNPQKRLVFPSMWFGMAANRHPKELYFQGVEIVENHYTPTLWCKARIIMLKNMLGNLVREIIK